MPSHFSLIELTYYYGKLYSYCMCAEQITFFINLKQLELEFD